jgi:alpha-beta hydrolase superfamily lysophospholipase
MNQGSRSPDMTENVTFQTSDGVRIAAVYDAAARPGPAALLLHMMPATKESWADSGFTRLLVQAGFSVLAIDLRGHGQSRTAADGRQLDYKLFGDREHQAKVLDVEAAAAWLKQRAGVTEDRLTAIGASIGANLSIAFAAAHPRVPAAVALSPGLDYRGVTTPDKVRHLVPGQSLFLAASSEDELSFQTNRRLAEIRSDILVKEFDGAGHGTTMFQNRPELMGEIVAWLKEKVD